MNERLDLSSGETEVFFGINGLGNGLGSCEGKWLCWCLVDLYIKNRFFFFNRTSDEMLTLGEVDCLKNALDDLLNDRISQQSNISFIEPDLEFVLSPKFDVRESENHIWVREGMEIVDIGADIVIHLSDMKNGYNGQTFSLPLDRMEISKLKLYLDEATTKLHLQWDNHCV